MWIIVVEEDRLRVADPRGQTSEVAWGAIERVVIRTTDLGPFAPDVFWLIDPIEEETIVIPGNATGESEMLGAMQQRLPGFRNDQLTEAMTSTSNREFVVWERDRLCPRCGSEIPYFPGISHAQKLAWRRLIDASGPIPAMKQLRQDIGCDLGTAKRWVHHRGIAGLGHEPLAPCPHCGQPLRSAASKQCRFCRRDWHDPERIVLLGKAAVPPSE
jgi:hypothetical protein